MTNETMNTALQAEGLCWTLGPGGACLVDATHAYATMTARNAGTLSQYVATAGRKGKTEAECATALRAKVDGNPVPWDDIVAGPDV